MNPPASSQTVICRQTEKRLLATALASPDPELIAKHVGLDELFADCH